MNREIILKEGQVKRPFEARIISNELRARVEFFRNLLKNKNLKPRLSRKIKHKSL